MSWSLFDGELPPKLKEKLDALPPVAEEASAPAHLTYFEAKQLCNTLSQQNLLNQQMMSLQQMQHAAALMASIKVAKQREALIKKYMASVSNSLIKSIKKHT